jgi:CHAT domain-containing protein/tetratricopeptide (TPR) repeat protein
VGTSCHIGSIPSVANDKLSKQARDRGARIAETAVRDPEGALRAFEDLLPQFTQAGDLEGKALTINNVGVLLRRLGRYSESLARHREALAIRRQYDDCAALAQSLNNLAVTLGVLGREQEALTALQDALDIRRRLGDVARQANTLVNIALARRRLGQFEEAFKAAYEALDLHVGDAEGGARNTLGLLDQDVAKYGDALSEFRQAETFHLNRDDLLGARSAALNIGQILHQLGDAEGALDAFTRMLSYSKRPKEKAISLMNLALAKANVGRVDEALADGQQALGLVGDDSDQANTASLLGDFGLVLRRKGDPTGALGYFERSLALTQRAPDAGISPTSRVSEATALQAIGTILEEQGRTEEALDRYRKAIGIREGMRSSVGTDELRSGFADRISNLYDRTILLLIKLGQPKEAFAYSERSRARTFIESMSKQRLVLPDDQASSLGQQLQDAAAELASLERDIDTAQRSDSGAKSTGLASLVAQLDRKRSEYETLSTRLKLAGGPQTALLDLDPMSLEQIQGALGPDTALISYVTTSDATIAFVIKRASFEAVTLPVSQSKITEAVEWFRAFARTDVSSPDDATLTDLYSWLIKPIAPMLTGVVGIVPNGPLHYLPFSALSDGRTYFGESRRLFYLPSVDFLRFMLPASEPAESRALVLAHSRAGLPKLEYAEQEAERVARAYGLSPLTDGDASESALRRLVPASTVLHVAAHGQLNAARPIFSRILLAGDDSNDGALNVYELYGIDLSRVRLVVLSACETQLGRRSSGDEIISLNRAFLLAKARTLVASLWSVDDEASSLLMETFHAGLIAGHAATKALQEAQDMVRAKYPHPYYWAGFVINGAPGEGLVLPLKSTAGGSER